MVMYTGNLDPYQDLDVLWDAFAKLHAALPKSVLVVVTHEAKWHTRVPTSLHRLLRSGAAQIVVAPTFAVVRRAMENADVLVSPRQSWSGYPIKLLNYLASGRAVVAAAGSAKGIIDGGNGLIFPNGDADALAATLERLAHDVPLRVRLGEAARAAARVAAANQGVEAVEAIYTRVCGREPHPRWVSRSRQETSPQGLMTPLKDRISAASGE